MKKILCIYIGVFCISCIAQETTGTITDSATILGFQLEIVNENGACTLKYSVNGTEKRIALKPKPPCFFLRRDKTTPQYFEYADVGVRATLIVVGTLISDDQRATWSLAPELICGSERQGVLISRNNIVASTHILGRGVACKDKGSDEKDFWFFAHQTPL